MVLPEPCSPISRCAGGISGKNMYRSIRSSEAHIPLARWRYLVIAVIGRARSCFGGSTDEIGGMPLLSGRRRLTRVSKSSALLPHIFKYLNPLVLLLKVVKIESALMPIREMISCQREKNREEGGTEKWRIFRRHPEQRSDQQYAQKRGSHPKKFLQVPGSHACRHRQNQQLHQQHRDQE